MDKDYIAIVALVAVSAIAVMAIKAYFGDIAAGLATIMATILAVGKCLFALRATMKQEKNMKARMNGSEDVSFAPVGRMSQFP